MNFQSWYAGLGSRDRQVLLWGSAVAAVLLVAGGLASLSSAVTRAEQRVERKRDDLAWMQAAAPRLQAMPATRGDEPLPLLVDRTARDAGLGGALSGVEPAAGGGLRVRFESATFDTLVLWLARVQQERGLVVESASIDGTGTAGLVNASIVLRGP
jgi:type II secretory pathway component PulM